MSATAQTDSWRRHNHLGPPWYSAPLSARCEPDPLVSCCHSSHVGRQIGDIPCGVPFASPPTAGSVPDRLFRRGFPILMAGHLKAKHVDWISRLRLDGRNSNLIMPTRNPVSSLVPDSPTSNQCNPSATLDVLDFIITKNLSFPVYLTSCSALSLEHLPFLIDNACRSSFLHPPDRPDFRRTD